MTINKKKMARRMFSKEDQRTWKSIYTGKQWNNRKYFKALKVQNKQKKI